MNIDLTQIILAIITLIGGIIALQMTNGTTP